VLVGQALDLDADHAERSIRGASHVEIGPDIDRGCAVRRMLQLTRILWLAIGGFVCQPKRLTMQPRPSAASPLFGGAIHHALLGQAHQQVSVHIGVCQGLQVIPTVQRHNWTGSIRALGLTDRSDLLERHFGRRLRRRTATLHVERQHPATSGVATSH
jgi:hypothetical protein